MQPQFFDLANGSPGYFNHPRAASADEQLQLREAHHRIKNDLQIVASLLAIQARGSDDAVRGPLIEAAKRVQAVARLHQRLQLAEGGQVEVSQLLGDLCHDLLDCGLDRPGVSVIVSAEPALLDGDQASSLALIANELILNAMKHAFAAGGGQLKVDFRVCGALGELVVSDDGPGLPARIDAEAGLGLGLVARLARKLGGQVFYDRAQVGARIRIVFPVITLDLRPEA
jgi:two-component sensor histidine kinase